MIVLQAMQDIRKVSLWLGHWRRRKSTHVAILPKSSRPLRPSRPLRKSLRASTKPARARPIRRPTGCLSYFGGRLARDLEAQGEAAFAAFATDQLAALMGSSIRKRLHPIAVSLWARSRCARLLLPRPSRTCQCARHPCGAGCGESLFFAGAAEACARSRRRWRMVALSHPAGLGAMVETMTPRRFPAPVDCRKDCRRLRRARSQRDRRSPTVKSARPNSARCRPWC
jgi:hypothetical protein